MRTKAHFQQNHIFIKTIMKWHKVFKSGWLWMICSMLEQIWNKTRKWWKRHQVLNSRKISYQFGSGDDMQYWETFQRSVQDLLIQILNRKQSTCMHIKYHFWYQVYSTFENTAKMSKTFRFQTPSRDSNLTWKKHSWSTFGNDNISYFRRTLNILRLPKPLDFFFISCNFYVILHNIFVILHNISVILCDLLGIPRDFL